MIKLTDEQKALIKRWILETIVVDGIHVEETETTSEIAFILIRHLGCVGELTEDEKIPLDKRYPLNMRKIIERLCAEAGVIVPKSKKNDCFLYP